MRALQNPSHVVFALPPSSLTVAHHSDGPLVCCAGLPSSSRRTRAMPRSCASSCGTARPRRRMASARRLRRRYTAYRMSVRPRHPEHIQPPRSALVTSFVGLTRNDLRAASTSHRRRTPPRPGPSLRARRRATRTRTGRARGRTSTSPGRSSRPVPFHRPPRYKSVCTVARKTDAARRRRRRCSTHREAQPRGSAPASARACSATPKRSGSPRSSRRATAPSLPG